MLRKRRGTVQMQPSRRGLDMGSAHFHWSKRQAKRRKALASARLEELPGGALYSPDQVEDALAAVSVLEDEDIRQMPPAERKRLADLCRQVAEMAESRNPRNTIARDVAIDIPPCTRLDRLARCVFRKRVYKTVLKPCIAETQHEYIEALREGDLQLAKRVRIRGVISFPDYPQSSATIPPCESPKS